MLLPKPWKVDGQWMQDQTGMVGPTITFVCYIHYAHNDPYWHNYLDQ